MRLLSHGKLGWNVKNPPHEYACGNPARAAPSSRFRRITLRRQPPTQCGLCTSDSCGRRHSLSFMYLALLGLLSHGPCTFLASERWRLSMWAFPNCRWERVETSHHQQYKVTEPSLEASAAVWVSAVLTPFLKFPKNTWPPIRIMASSELYRHQMNFKSQLGPLLVL